MCTHCNLYCGVHVVVLVEVVCVYMFELVWGGVVVKLCIYIVHGVCGSSGSSVYIFCVCEHCVWCWCCIVHNYVEVGGGTCMNVNMCM